ncbi:HD domain-containing protein [Saccharothrix xinjiangensis]|uniref:HD domain-containing protein n=1 Tax=Saccharothrix xinjiangensis TaxID=204798 RepID=A0ABV9XZJ1_9PSEU
MTWKGGVNAFDFAYGVAERCLRNSLPRRWVHVQGVAKRAGLSRSLFSSEDGEVLVAAAMLHDVGYSPGLVNSGFHPLDGALYLQSLGCPERICALVAHHSCAYKEAKLRQLTTELAVWEDEDTDVRDALWWADMTTTPDGYPTNVASRIREIQERYGPTDLVTAFISEAKSELVAAVERTEERLRVAGLGHLAK